jgi:hypothetical protein
MGKTASKAVYSITAYDDLTATAVYSCLKTLCEAWGLMSHYSTVWRRLREEGLYRDPRVIIKKHALIKSKYQSKSKRNEDE